MEDEFTSILSGDAPIRFEATIPTSTLIGLGAALFVGIFLAMVLGFAVSKAF